MTTTDVDACVVDTNVLIYSTVLENPWYQRSRQWLSMLQVAGVELCVTTQILREYMVVLTRGIVRLATYNRADFAQFDGIVLEQEPALDVQT